MITDKNMDNGNLCDNGRCKRVRMGEERHEKHTEDKESKMKLSQILAIIFGLTYGVALGVIMGIHFLGGMSTVVLDDENTWLDFKNWVAMVVTLIIPIGVAFALWYYSHKQSEMMHDESKNRQKEISDLAKDVHDFTEGESVTHKEIEELVSFNFLKQLRYVERSLKRTKEIHENYKKESDSDKKQEHLDNMIKKFDSCYSVLKTDIQFLDMVKIFGKATTLQFFSFLYDLKMATRYYELDPPSEISEFILHVNDCLKNTESLKNIFKPLSSQQVKSR